MIRRSLQVWDLAIDPAETRKTYARIRQGAALRCGCVTCRNFDRVRPRHYPKQLREILAQVSVNPCKELDVRLVAPLEGNLQLYAGSYAFCGEILVGRPYRGFPVTRDGVDVFERLAPGTHVALRPWPTPRGAWDAGRPCVRIEFLVVLPWVSTEPRPPLLDLGRRERDSCNE